jgi:hypothetical protein
VYVEFVEALARVAVRKWPSRLDPFPAKVHRCLQAVAKLCKQVLLQQRQLLESSMTMGFGGSDEELLLDQVRVTPSPPSPPSPLSHNTP